MPRRGGRLAHGRRADSPTAGARWIVLVVAAAAASALPGSAMAQDFEVSLGAGGFVDYPRPFSDPYCEQNAVAFSANGAWRALPLLSLDLGVVAATGAGSMTCAIPLFAPLPPDTPYERRSYGDPIAGTGLFATNLSAVFEPFPTAPITPRARLGAGLLWDKELGNWLWGVGVRYRFGRHSFVTDFEGWNLRLERFVETVVLRSSTMRTEVLSTESHIEHASPFFIRLAWSIDVR